MTTGNRVAILDAGGQYIDLVRKAVERQGIPAEVLPLNTPREQLEGQYGAIIISGSPASSHAEAAPQPDPAVWQSLLPLLGICYGMQAMVVALGGEVAKNAIREDGRVTTGVDLSHALFKGTKKDFTALFTHGDFVKKVPEGFEVLGSHSLSDGSTAFSSIAKGNKLGVQFHPEVFDDTPQGYQVFKNFLVDIAGLKPDPEFQERQLRAIIEVKQKEIERLAKGRPVIAFVSGGVDSSVAATLAAGVLGDQMHAYYIDSGFMRDEDDQVIELLQAAGLSVKKIDAAADFEQALGETTDPETKRQIIGKVFIEVQNKIVASLKLSEALLLQGTNAADRIESGQAQLGSYICR